MYSEGASVSQCAEACDADETCVAFDFGSEDGYCYAYKADPLAAYVASGDPEWSCYNKIAMHEDCDASFINDVVVLFTSYQSL
jgi:hypothetical protein